MPPEARSSSSPKTEDGAASPIPLPGRPQQSLAESMAWVLAVRWSSQGISWVSTVVLARLLSPGEFGLVGMAAVVLSLITMLTEFGLGTAIVTRKDVGRPILRQLATTSLIFGTVGYCVASALAYPLGLFFHQANLPPVVLVLAVTFVASSFQIVPNSVLQSEFQFRTIAVISGMRSLVQAVITVVLALLGWSYWALVVGSVTGAAAAAATTMAVRPIGFARPRIPEVRPVLQLAGRIVVGRLSWFIYSNADFIVVGRRLGESALGAYTFAWTMSSVAVEKITAAIGSVTPAFLAARQTDVAELRRLFLSMTRGLALVAVPACVGISLVGADLVHVVFGSQWDAAITPLRLLALYASVRCITPIAAQVLIVTGDAGYAARNGTILAVALPTGFWIGSHYGGVVGVAAAWLAIHPFIVLWLYRRLSYRLDLALADYYRCLWPVVAATGAMAVVVTLFGHAVAGWSTVLRLVASVTIGAAVYGAWLWFGYREIVLYYWSYARALRRARV